MQVLSFHRIIAFNLQISIFRKPIVMSLIEKLCNILYEDVAICHKRYELEPVTTDY